MVNLYEIEGLTPKDNLNATDVNKQVDELLGKEDVSKKDLYDALGLINRFENVVPMDVGLFTKKREQILGILDDKFPNRGLKDKEGETKAKFRSPFFEEGKPFTEDMVKLAVLEGKEKKAKKDEEERIGNLGFFGKMMETLKTDADARQKFFDQLGGIGAEISRPTEPGEARSLARDLIVGSERGEGKTIAKRKAAAETMADAALAQQRANPMQYYTTAMKELTQQAIAEGFQPGTLAFTKYVGARLRDKGISEQALTYSEVLKNLNEQLLTAQATGEQEKIDQILQQISQTQNLLNTVLGGTSTGASNVVSYKPQ